MANKPARAKLRLWKKLAFSAVTLLFLLVCLELSMRVCGYGPPTAPTAANATPDGPRKPDPLAYFAVCDRHLGFRNRPHGSYRAWYIEGNPLATTDEFGYRNGYGWPGDGDAPMVVFVGDSITFCAEVEDAQTGPSEVAKLLSEEFDVRVLNAAVRAYGTLQVKRMLIECLERFPQIQLAVYTFCGNDLEESMVPNLRFPLKAPVMLRDAQTGEFQEVEVSEPAVPWGQGFLHWDPDQPVSASGSRVTAWLATRSALCYQCLAGWRRLNANRFDSQGFPNGTQVVPPEDHYYWHIWAAENGGDEVLRRLLVEMDEACRAHGAVLVVTSAFAGTQYEACREFSAWCADVCAEAGVPFVPLDHEFADGLKPYTCVRLGGMPDGHLNPRGTKAYARALAPTLKRILRARIKTGT